MQVYKGIMRTENFEDVILYGAANTMLEAKGLFLDEALAYRAFDLEIERVDDLKYEGDEPCLVCR